MWHKYKDVDESNGLIKIETNLNEKCANCAKDIIGDKKLGYVCTKPCSKEKICTFKDFF